ncbi:MAG TPA: SDR family NAD(P)-dependent oxidoreductase [Burkholderiales bacterium]
MTQAPSATRVAVVTGAARGIGARIADRLEEAGYFVYRADVLPGAPLALDVADRASVRAAFGRVGAERGGLDVLVNNAGLLAAGPFEQTSGEAWDRLLGVNLTGVFNCVTAALPLLRGRPGASIINIASVSAEKGGGAMGNVWYGATKAGVVAMTRGLGRELGPSGIRVNAISPSVIDTYMVREHFSPEVRERVLTRFPLGRLATEDDVAGVAVFLASPAAGFITGETISVDGGFLRT